MTHYRRTLAAVLSILLSLLMMARVSKGLATTSSKPPMNVHWFRLQDLRLHDNPALTKAAASSGGSLLPVFCFDPRIFGGLI